MEGESPRKICDWWHLIWAGREKSLGPGGVGELLESLLLDVKWKGRSLLKVECLTLRFCS